MFHDNVANVNQLENIAIKYRHLIGYLEEQTSLIAELESILVKTGRNSDSSHEEATTTQSVIRFLGDLQIKNQQMIQSQTMDTTRNPSSLAFVASSAARVSYELDDIQDRKISTGTTRKGSSRARAGTTNRVAAASASDNYYGHANVRRETASSGIAKATVDSSTSRIVHFEASLLGNEPSESLLLSSDADGSSSEQNLPPTVIASHQRHRFLSVGQAQDPSSPGLGIATPPAQSRSRKKTLCPPTQVKLSDFDSSMSVLSETGASPVDASRRRPPERMQVEENEVSSNQCNTDEHDSWSTETPFFDRFRVDCDPSNPRQVIVRPNPRRSRRGKLAEQIVMAQRRRLQQQVTIDENAPLEFSPKPSPPGQAADLSIGRIRDVFRVNETMSRVGDTPHQTSEQSSRYSTTDRETTDHEDRRAFQNSSVYKIDEGSAIGNMQAKEFKSSSGLRRTPLTAIARRDHISSYPTRSAKSLPSSLLLFAEAHLIANEIPQILPIGREEYNSAPRLVHLQVSLELLKTVIDTLNEKIADSIAGQPHKVKRMHIRETDLLVMCRHLLDDDNENTKCQNILSALCYLQRLWMRAPLVAGESAVFDIIFNETAWGPE